MFDNSYLVDMNIDISSLNHKIAQKSLISYKNYPDSTKEIFNKMNTVYQLMNVQLEEIDIAATSYPINYIITNLPKETTKTKILRSVNNLFSEMLFTLALSNRSLMLNQIFRQIIEYFTVFDIITNNPDEIAVLYFNHVHALEYKAVKEEKKYIDSNLESIFQNSVHLFAQYHNLDFETAKKEYMKNFGWAYKLVKDREGNNVRNITPKTIREYVLRKYFDKKDIEIINRYIKTADIAIHPTSTYVYILSRVDEVESDYAETLIDWSITFYIHMLKVYKLDLKPNSTVDKLVEYCVDELSNIKKTIPLQKMQYCDDYKNINSYKKYSSKYIDSKEKAKLILSNFEGENVTIIDFHETLHFMHYNLGSFKKRQYKTLDNLYAIIDSHFENVYSFYPKILDESNLLRNIRKLYMIIALLFHELTVSYAFQKITLFQKAYRLILEYFAVFHKLIKSDENVNDAFKSLSYVLLKDSIYCEDFDHAKSSETIEKICNILNLDENNCKSKIENFMGWTAHYNKKKTISTVNLSSLTQSYIANLAPNNKALSVLWKECSHILHADLYADEINNDLIINEYGIIDYILGLYFSSIQIIEDITKFSEQVNNQKLIESMHLIQMSLKISLAKYTKYLRNLKKRIHMNCPLSSGHYK